MTDTATNVNEITTHFFGDMMARDLGFSHNCYGALASIPHATDTRGALVLDDALDQVADASTPRAPVDLPFTGDEMKPPRAYGGAIWINPNKEEAEEEERVWVNDYDSDATLPIEREYAYSTEAGKEAQRLLLRAPGDSPLESEEEEAMEVEDAAPAAPAAAVSVRVCLEWQPKKTWAGAVPARKPKKSQKNKKARLPKKLRVVLPLGLLDNDEEETLSHGVLLKGMAGGKREERIAHLKTARQLGRATRRLGKAIGDEINTHIPVGEPLLSFGRGADDDVDLMGTGKGVARHAAKIMAARDRLRAPENAAAAAADGVLVQWPECLPHGVLRCPELHAYLDAWAAHVY
jgi:hypothetical protein